MVKYEDYMDGPINTTNSLLDKLKLPNHPDMHPLLVEVERQQLDQVMMWTGNPDKDLDAWIRTEQSKEGREVNIPNVYLDQDLVSKFITSFTKNTMSMDIWTVHGHFFG